MAGTANETKLCAQLPLSDDYVWVRGRNKLTTSWDLAFNYSFALVIQLNERTLLSAL